MDSPGKIEGTVIDGTNNEPLPFAHIIIEGTDFGTSCDEAGAFRITLPAGTYSIIGSYIGYATLRIENAIVAPDAVIEFEIRLNSTSEISPEVIITATQRSQHIHLAPASIGVVTAKDLTERQVSTFDQAFDQITGVEVTRSSGSNVQAFSIRGASEVAGGGIGNRVLLLIDGRPAISPESGGALWNLVPLSSIDHIEVVKGAYSSLYGSSAMGGVVNVITRKPATDPVTHVHLNYGFYHKAPSYTGYMKIGDFNTISYSRSHVTGKFSYLFDLSRRQDDGHREKSGFTLYNGFTKLQYDLSRQRSFYFSLNLNKIKNDTPATWFSTLESYSVAPHRKDDYQDRREWNADLQYHVITSSRTKYDSRFYYYDNYSKFTFNDDPENDSTNINIGKQDVDHTSVRAKRIGNVSQIDLALNDIHYVICGIDMKYDWIDGVPDTVLYGKHTAASIGAYIQDEINLGKFTATGGMRYDYYRIISEFSESNFSPKFAIVYAASDRFSLRALMAQAFRNPSIAERFIKFEQGGGLRFEPNPSLRAEKLIFSTEIGTRIKITEHVEMDAALFYNHYKDLISYQQISALPLTFRVVNLNKAVMQGFECNVKYEIPKYFTLHTGYTFLDARDVSPERYNDVLAYKVKHTFHFSATGFYKQLTLNINGRYRSAIEEVFIYPGSEPDANFLLNLKLTYKLLDKHNLYVAVNNMTDKQYEELERYRMAGRSYTAGAVFVF
ncbi:MAG TPA: TonB-dependent receptor [Saprospiraceae bacterium]|nr:TonB-dependent receptor [Saprospiraceae bacterium]